MKKVLLAILLFAGIGITTATAQNLYEVNVSVKVTTHYYEDEDLYHQVKTKDSFKSEIFTVCKGTPEAAKNEAKSECSTVCSRSGERRLGRQMDNGKFYYVTETRQVYDANATYKGACN